MKKFLIAVLFAVTASLCAEITQFSLLPADWQGKSYNFLEGYPANLVIAYAGPGKQLAADPPTLIMELPEFLELKGIYTRVGWGKQFPLKKESSSIKLLQRSKRMRERCFSHISLSGTCAR